MGGIEVLPYWAPPPASASGGTAAARRLTPPPSGDRSGWLDPATRWSIAGDGHDTARTTSARSIRGYGHDSRAGRKAAKMADVGNGLEMLAILAGRRTTESAPIRPALGPSVRMNVAVREMDRVQGVRVAVRATVREMPLRHADKWEALRCDDRTAPSSLQLDIAHAKASLRRSLPADCANLPEGRTAKRRRPTSPATPLQSQPLPKAPTLLQLQPQPQAPVAVPDAEVHTRLKRPCVRWRSMRELIDSQTRRRSLGCV